MKVKVLKKGKKTEQLLKNLRQSVSVSVGHFSDQDHYSGYTLPELMNFHHKGTGTGKGTVPARPVLSILNFQMSEEKGQVFKGLNVPFKAGLTPKSMEAYFKQVGERIKVMEQSIFGDTKLLRPNAVKTQQLKGGNSPLVDTGALKEGVEVRVNKK